MKVGVSLFVQRSTVEEDLINNWIKSPTRLHYVFVSRIEAGGRLAVAADDCPGYGRPVEKRN